MKISVIAPCLNEERYLPMFLKSLQHQTFKDFEVVLVDGKSVDATPRIIAIYAPKLDLKVVVDATRNFGYLRNVGAAHAEGMIHFQTSVDTYFEPNLLQEVARFYDLHPNCVSLAGRTFPLGTSLMAHLGYQIFDFLRYLFTVYPMPIRKYRPSGNFTTMRRKAYDRAGGYPEVTVNEDGLMGQRLDLYALKNHRAVNFNLRLYVGHHARKFEKMGGVRAILFYFYTLANLFPMLKPFVKHIEWKAGKVFEGKT